jgi:exosortase C (VPDSG-CTERM-specific)
MEEGELITEKHAPVAPPFGRADIAGLRPPLNGAERVRLIACIGFAAGLSLAYAKPLMNWAVYAMKSELSSYVLLAPLVSAYLIGVQWRCLPRGYSSSFVLAGPLAVTAAAALGFWWRLGGSAHPPSVNDALSLIVVSFVGLLWAIGFLFLGWRWMASVAFAAVFLLFMVPLPDAVVDCLERGSTLASAEAADRFFSLAGVAALRDGVIFQLPDITIQVAQECSGIRSSLVLFITSLVAGRLFLRSRWRQAALVACIIPLAIARNGFRILVIGWLCVHFGPEMIHNPIHKRGGPLFFALSMPFLLLFLWCLTRGEGRGHRQGATGEGVRGPGAASG